MNSELRDSYDDDNDDEVDDDNDYRTMKIVAMVKTMMMTTTLMINVPSKLCACARAHKSS